MVWRYPTTENHLFPAEILQIFLPRRHLLFVKNEEPRQVRLSTNQKRRSTRKEGDSSVIANKIIIRQTQSLLNAKNVPTRGSKPYAPSYAISEVVMASHRNITLVDPTVYSWEIFGVLPDQTKATHS